MDTIYYIIYGVLLTLSVIGLKVGVSNDAANFLNTSLGCRAGSFYTVLTVASVGVLLGACFSSGMMEVARSGVFNPSMFSFHEVMLLFLAVMISNVILLEAYNTLGLPTSTTLSLVFALLGSALGMAVYSSRGNPDAALADYINTGNALTIVVAIFVSVVIAFIFGSLVMWFARLRKKARSLKQELKPVKENEVQPTLASIPKELVDRGQLIYRITEVSLSTCACLVAAVKASYKHIDNNHTALTKTQGDDLIALTSKIGQFYPRLTDMLKAGDHTGIDRELAAADQLNADFAELITRHLMHNATDESSLRIGILYLTLLNETRDMVSRSFSLISCIKELGEG